MSWNILLALYLSSVSASQYFACPPANFSIFEPDMNGLIVVNMENISIDFKYERDTLGVYVYPDTLSVNLFIGGTFYSYRALNSKGKPSRFNSSQREFEVIGQADLVGVDNTTKIMVGCQFFLANRMTGELLRSSVDETLQRCLDQRLCRSLGPVTSDDYLRALQNPLAFGPISVNPNKNIHYYSTINLVLQRLTQKFQNDKNTTVKVVDDPYEYVHAYRGSYKFLGNSLRSSSTNIREDTKNNTTHLSFTIMLGEGFLIYEDLVFAPMQIVLFSLCSRVHGASLDISLTFNFTNGCELQNATVVSRDFGSGIPFSCQDNATYRHDRWLQYLLDNSVNEKIIGSVATEVAKEITPYLKNEFNCNILKPSKYHYGWK